MVKYKSKPYNIKEIESLLDYSKDIPIATQGFSRSKQQQEKYEDLKIINFSLPNEPEYKKTERPELIPFAQWHEILKMSNCKGFISVDSCLNHFARSAGRKGVVIWGGTRWIQFGYKQNRNINKWWSEWDEWDNEKFEPQDPRNIMVEPEVVFEQFEKIYGKELIK